MRFSTAGTIAACIAAASAFKDTSPFLLFSNQDIWASQEAGQTERLSDLNQIDSASSVTTSLVNSLVCLPVETLLIVVQPDANAADYSSKTAAPHLRKALKTSVDDGPVYVGLNVAEVVGAVDVDGLQTAVEASCGFGFQQVEAYGDDGVSKIDFTPASDKESAAKGVRVNLQPLSNEPAQRVRQVAYHDVILQELLAQLKGRSYAVLFATIPVNAKAPAPIVHDSVSDVPNYEPEFQEPLHSEIKRQTGAMRRAEDGKKVDTRPLFEKYQFFTPGIFMGLLVTIVLVAILSVGIRGIAGLEVSYAAFEKEMGPAAQKKAQ
ncbi:hypothetical protein O988_07504 [Pseudogymnoascus sp. VKM F-3808]|nr:hypothetical protein V490_07916 [Pseudogymnoascus sp. VKM F-3557]KFX91932.1 hypothetical protein O988_07504 [Pseudogymnoascus sp. VKM F-3808]KFY46617.1 hypothetical protein V495_02351 [Pseudogymnoascus sp. VKM F-4514 (FW-929)]KFY59895.1 hypothetical protein V497_04022 [Pseudogymnoascus sp. VKM F-4516 (FW-969)]